MCGHGSAQTIFSGNLFPEILPALLQLGCLIKYTHAQDKCPKVVITGGNLHINQWIQADTPINQLGRQNYHNLGDCDQSARRVSLNRGEIYNISE